MASFGWSAGDIIATINLVSRVIQCIHSSHGATEHFQELVSELQGLSRALSEIAELTRIPGQTPEIQALKFASCACTETLQRFYEKIRPFEDSLGIGSSHSTLKSVPRMVRWELLVKKDVPELRSYIVAHVGSLNLRLSTALLKGSSSTQASLTRTYEKQTHLHEDLTANHADMIKKIAQIPTADTTPKLDSLLTIALGVWKSQYEILSHLGTGSVAFPAPDLEHTWAQAPVKFEDALGRRFVVPSEYDWDKLEVIIQAQFRVGPGSAKVRSGEYELFDRSTGESISCTNFTGLVPGSFVAMAIIVGQYRTQEFVGSCTRFSCRSSRVRKVNSKLIVCMECQSMFRISTKPLARPMKPMLSETIAAATTTQKDIDSASTALMDRRHYKNVSVCLVELPATPSVFREKYHRDYQPPIHKTLQSENANIDSKLSQKTPSGSLRRFLGIASKVKRETDSQTESSSIRNSYGVRSTLQRRISRTPLARLNFNSSAKERDLTPKPLSITPVEKRRSSWIEPEESIKTSTEIVAYNTKGLDRRRLSEFTEDELLAEIKRRQGTNETKARQEIRPSKFLEDIQDINKRSSVVISTEELSQDNESSVCQACAGLTWIVVGDFMEACKICQKIPPGAKVRLDGILDPEKRPTPTTKSLPELARDNARWVSKFEITKPRPASRHEIFFKADERGGVLSPLRCVCGFTPAIGDEGLRADCFNRMYIPPAVKEKRQGKKGKAKIKK